MPGTGKQAALRVSLTICHNEHFNIKTIPLTGRERQGFSGKQGSCNLNF